jgi:DTW domain-containing protein YfiP
MKGRQMNKRQICTLCSYPQSTCLCDWVSPITSPLNIIILQHPKETKHAKNTVKLLTLGLDKVTVLRGEKPEDWAELVQKVSEQPHSYCLFYPHEKSIPIESIFSLQQNWEPHSTELRNVELQSTGLFPLNHNVIFIDASWRKALKIWHLNPWLRQCVSWHFATPPENQYHIRQTTQRSSLSTLESVAYVLEQTHNIDCTPLHTLFSKMQQKCFIKNYPQIDSSTRGIND